MRVWLLKISEPLPIDGEHERLFRMGQIADHLNKAGHQVHWFASTHDHFRRKLRFKQDKTIQLDDDYHLHLLHGPDYAKRVSIKRVINHQVIANKFVRLAKTMAKPDIILAALPTISLAAKAVAFAKQNNIPIIIDLRDQWPDVFVERTPRYLRPIICTLLNSKFKQARVAIQNATGLFAITPAFLEWGLKYANRAKAQWDCVFPLAYDDSPAEPKSLDDANQYWRELGVIPEDNSFILTYIGSIKPMMDLTTLIKATKYFDFNYKLIIAGLGDELEALRSMTKNNPNIIVPGWIDKPKIAALMKMSHVGLAPYKNSPDFIASIPNKPIEYFSAGLPVITCLKGLLAETLEQKNCGLVYREGDADDFAKKIKQLQTNIELRKSMSVSAKTLFEAGFSGGSVYKALAEKLESIVQDHEKAYV